MSAESLGRVAARAVVTLAIAGAIGGGLPSSTLADTAARCAGATPPAASRAATPPAAAALPTEAAIATESNPPGDIPDNQAFVTYVSPTGGYSVAMPEGWARTESGPDVAFVDKLHRFTVEITCAKAAPTVDSAKSNDAVNLARQVPAFELVGVKALDLPAGPAVLIQYRTNSAPDEVTGKQIRLDVDRYEIFKGGQLAVISLAVPAGSDNVDVSAQVAGSFRWTA